MGGLLGPPGGLQELRCASALSEAPVRGDIRSITMDADGGEHAQLHTVRPNRVWEAEVGSTTPAEMGVLAKMAARSRRSRTPLVYYSEAAQVENLLDPGASLMDMEWWTGMTEGGGEVLPDPHLPAPWFDTSGACRLDGSWGELPLIPIPHLRDVSVAVHVTAYQGWTAQAQITEYAVDGAPIAGTTRELTTTGVLDRLTWSITTSGATAYISLRVRNANTVVAPQITLTREPPALWAEGTGSLSVLIQDPPTRVAQLAIPDVSWGVRSGYSWSLREVGRNGIYS